MKSLIARAVRKAQWIRWLLVDPDNGGMSTWMQYTDHQLDTLEGQVAELRQQNEQLQKAIDWLSQNHDMPVF